MSVGQVVVIGGAGGIAVWLAWRALGRLVWLCARIQREIDDVLWNRDQERLQSFLERTRDDFTETEQDLLERARRIDAIIRKAEEMGTDLEDFARLCADLAPTAADIEALRFFNLDDWTAAA